MGDCQIRILIAKQLIPSAKEDLLTSRMYSSDTTIREVIEDNKVLFDLFSSTSSFHLWDTTLSPAKNITDWPLKEYPELQGPKSKTLHSAGFFPSAQLLVLPKDVEPSKFKIADYEDSQYNRHQQIISDTSIPAIQFKAKELASSSSKPLPSMVMQSVTTRFDNDEDMNKEGSRSTSDIRLKNIALRRKMEQERAAKLDQRIQKLEEQSSEKNRKVSDQVKKMLVKSRATGAKSLKMQDRLYFECMVDKNDDLTKEYRFFSQQDTFARIASSFSSPDQSDLKHNELLVKKMDNTTNGVVVYQRLPVAMRVYEAIAGGFLKGELDTLIIRWYKDDEEPTPSITENRNGGSEDTEMQDTTNVAQENEKIQEKIVEEAIGGALLVDKSLAEAILIMDEKLSKGKKPKKKSAAALKVRNMQMKSKAKGDARRVSKVEERFFLDVVMVSLDNVAQSSFHFLSKKDPIERLLQVVSAGATKAADWEFLVPTEEKFNPISDCTISLMDAEQQNVLKCFGRIILRPRS